MLIHFKTLTFDICSCDFYIKWSFFNNYHFNYLLFKSQYFFLSDRWAKFNFIFLFNPKDPQDRAATTLDFFQSNFNLNRFNASKFDLNRMNLNNEGRFSFFLLIHRIYFIDFKNFYAILPSLGMIFWFGFRLSKSIIQKTKESVHRWSDIRT